QLSVSDEAVAEEGIGAMASAVEELVGDDDVGRLVLELHRAHGADGDDALDAEHLEAVQVGAEVELRGQDAMAAPVARHEGDALAVEVAEQIGVRRRAPWGVACSLLPDVP